MSWDQAELAWAALLKEIETVQGGLGCTWSNAWFRGLDDSTYELVPSLLRLSWRDIPDEERKLQLHAPDAGVFDAESFKRVTRRRRAVRAQLFAARGQRNKRELEKLRAEYHSLKENERQLKAGANSPREYKPLLRLGERDAFINYQFQSGTEARNSWQVLAEMQHCGTPTRLLDWTDVLMSAFYFSLHKVRRKIEKFWFDQRTSGLVASAKIPFPPLSLIESLPKPCIWILNPYRLSRVSSQRNRVWDLTLDPTLDYYRRFLERKNWPFDAPIPIYSPWRSARIAAQRGMFLLWGYDKRPLDKIMLSMNAPGVLDRVVIEPLAAIQAVKCMRQLNGMDRFSMYRDLDALGGRVRREFLHDRSYGEEHFD